MVDILHETPDTPQLFLVHFLQDIIRGEFQKRLQKASEGPGQ